MAPSLEALYKAGREGWFDSVIEALAESRPAERRAVVEYTRGTSGWTLLHQAAYHNKRDVCRLLLDAGASPIALSTRTYENDDTTPGGPRLDPSAVAAYKGHGALSRELLAEAVDALVANASSGSWDVVIKTWRECRQLAVACARWRCESREGWTFAHFAAVAGCREALLLLAHFGANLNAGPKPGVVALATMGGHKEIVNLLASVGIRGDTEDNLDARPFPAALEGEFHPDLVGKSTHWQSAVRVPRSQGHLHINRTNRIVERGQEYYRDALYRVLVGPNDSIQPHNIPDGDPLPSPDVEGGGEPVDNLCVLCKEKERVYLLNPCKHFAICDGEQCVKWVTNNFCPLDHIPVRSVTKIFYP
jgi:hypothetical protein